MSKQRDTCSFPCTDVIKFLESKEVPPNTGISVPPYTKVDGYRHINIFVRFTQADFDEQPVDLGVIFAMDADGRMGARRYVNVEFNLPAPQGVNMITVTGEGTWHGSQTKISSFVARFPVMGPYVQVFVYNRESVPRTVDVWGYLVG